jgi:OmpA-OmpF porin, OOP family
MKIRGCLLAAAALTTLPVAANAAEVMYPKFTIMGGYSHAFADGDRQTDDGMGLFVGVGVPITHYFNVDFSAFHHGYDGRNRSGVQFPDITENGAKADFLFYYSRNRVFSPYVGFGAGYVKTKLDDTGIDGSEAFFDAGVGFQTYPFRKSTLGFVYDIRYRWMDDDRISGSGSRLEDVIARVGLVVPFGVTYTVTPPPLVEKAPPPPVKPAPEPTLGAERRFTDVLFAFDKSDLTPKAMSDLDSAAATINELSNQHPNLRVKVDGHTDWIGTDGYNQGLGERRASAVKNYLVRKGVAADRIDTTSYGESKPVASNETAEGRQLNRRAEVRTTGEK